MHFIEDDKLQPRRRLVIPKLFILTPHEEVIQHFVICQQDVRWVRPQRRLMRDDMPGTHDFMLARATNVHPGGDLVAQPFIRINGFRDAARLVFRQRIHGIQQHRLNSAAVRMAHTVIQNGIQKALGFTRARSRCHQCMLRSLSTA